MEIPAKGVAQILRELIYFSALHREIYEYRFVGPIGSPATTNSTYIDVGGDGVAFSPLRGAVRSISARMRCSTSCAVRISDPGSPQSAGSSSWRRADCFRSYNSADVYLRGRPN